MSESDDRKARLRLIAPSARKPGISLRPSKNESEHPVHQYRTHTTDNLGRSAKFSLSTRPDIRRIAAKLLTKELFPFETEQDVLRWCVDFGIAELVKRSKDKEVTGEWRRMNSLIRASRHELEQTYYERIIDQFRKTINILLRDGHLPKAESLAGEIWRNNDAIEDPYWRSYYRTKALEIKEQVARVKKVKAKEKDEEES